jgi:hypothetical protein
VTLSIAERKTSKNKSCNKKSLQKKQNKSEIKNFKSIKSFKAFAKFSGVVYNLPNNL